MGSKLDAQAPYLVGLVAAQVDLPLAEVQSRLVRKRGGRAAIGPLWGFYRKRALRVKKDRFGPPLWPGDGVSLDTLAVPKGQAVRRAIEAMGATQLFLPPYSPEYNPSEPGFAKLKAGLRVAVARTRATLWHAVGAALLAFTPVKNARATSPLLAMTQYSVKML